MEAVPWGTCQDKVINLAIAGDPVSFSYVGSRTLKGLAELEKSNPQLTIQLWNQAIPLLNSEKEKDDLRSLIEAVKKRKNQ